MGEGPTLVGSITAQLDLDMQKWHVKVGEIKDTSKELGALDPTVKVDANVGAALAKMDAVMSAEKRLEAAQRSKLNTSGALSLAEMRYEAVMTKSGRTDLQVAAAEEALARARRNDLAATEKSALATEMLNAVKSESAKKSLEQAAAEDAGAESSKRAVQANQQNVSVVGALIALSPAILAAAAPIGASAVGLGAAFGVMGVSGVLALKGIKDAMVVGDSVGNTYAAGLGSLKGDLDQLAATSANGMLHAFGQAVGDINDKMPFLSRMTGEFGGLLGQIGGTALRGMLDGLQQMNPLIQAGGIELGKFTGWLTGFSNTNGFQSFVSYAIDNLPAVMHLIENLVTTAGHLLAAFAPMGPVVIGVLNGITDVLNALPLPVLAGLVTTATAVAPAIRIAGSAMALFAIESQLAVPVVGIITAGLAGIGIAAATAALGTDQGSQSFKDYTQALKDDNEALGEHVRLQAAKALSDAGAYDAARTLGVSQTVLTDALMGVAGAQDVVNAAIGRGKDMMNDHSQGVTDMDTNIYFATDAQKNMGSAIDTVTKTLDSQRSSIERSKQINQDMAAANDRTTGSMDAQGQANILLAAKLGTTVAAIQSAKDAQDKAGQSTADATAKMQSQNDAAGILKMTLDGLNGKAISAAQAQNAFDSSLANMGDHVDQTGKKITFTTTSITDMSSASVALRGQLNGQVSNLQQVVEANGGLSESTGKAKAQMEDMRTQIINNAVAHGVDKDAVTKYVDGLLAIPKTIPPTKLDVNATDAELKVAGLQRAIDSLTGKTVDIYSVEHIQQVRDGGDAATANAMNTANQYAQGNAYASGKADGGPVGYKATGGAVAGYLASGGFPGGPKGTDTVPTWLTPGEFVMKRASSNSIGMPALDYMNRTGQLPPSGNGGAGPVNVTVMIAGEAVDPRLISIARQEAGAAVGAANQDAARRPSR